MNKMAIKNHFQLLEINIISAQDLEITSKKMKTYAKAWVHPTRKLSTRVDAEGQNNPTWNDKFVFRVDDQYLRQDTSSVMIEIYGVSWLRDKLVGTVHVLVGNLIPPARPHVPSHQIGMRFVALQVRRPSGRPQGILNIGVTLLDSSMRSMPLYRQMSKSAVGFHDLMLDDDPQLQSKYLVDNDGEDEEEDEENKTPVVKPILRRSRSERSERVTFDNASIAAPKSSIVGYNPKPKKLEKESSILSISDVNYPYNMKMKGKASSVISGAEPKRRVGRKGKASSVISDSIISTTFNNVKNGKLSKPTEVAKEKEKEKEKELDAGHEVEKLVEKIEKGEYPVPIDQSPPNNVAVDEKSIGGSPVKEITPNQTPKLIPKPLPKLNGYDYGGGVKGMRGGNGKYVMGAPYKANSVWSDSEVGPSPSEVAAAMMMERKYPLEEERSSVLDGWSVDESVEGLRSKLDRWRTELPPLYDRGGFSSSYRSSTQYSRKHSASGGRGRHAGPGLFSCFGNICGIECQCVCGQPPARKGQRFHSPSTGSRSFL